MTDDYPETLLPPNHAALEQHLEHVIRRYYATSPVDVLRQFWRPADCPTHLLPHLARQRSVDVWQDYWSDTRKRAVIDASIRLHRIKGTRGAIELALDALGQQYKLVEWWESNAANIAAIAGYVAAPCTAYLELAGEAIRTSGVVIPDILQAVQRAKRLSLHISIHVIEFLYTANQSLCVVTSHATQPDTSSSETVQCYRPQSWVYAHVISPYEV